MADNPYLLILSQPVKKKIKMCLQNYKCKYKKIGKRCQFIPKCFENLMNPG